MNNPRYLVPNRTVFNNTKQKGYSLAIQAMQTQIYIFPPVHQIPSVYRSLEEINTVMDLTLREHNLRASQGSKIQKTMILKKTHLGALLKCRTQGCSAFVTFMLKENIYRLANNDPEHQHGIKSSRRGRIPKVKNIQIQDCYDELMLLNYRPKQITQYITSKFGITRPHLQGIKFCRQKRQTIKNLLFILSKYDHFFFESKDIRQVVAYYKHETYPESLPRNRDVILLVSRQMKQLYENYHGQYVFFSMFPNIVLETRYTKSLNYQSIGILYGQEPTGNLSLMFGMVILRKPERLCYLYSLQRIFNFLGSYPKVIVTDFDAELSQAVRRLRVKCGVVGALRQHIQLPNNLATNFNHCIQIQFLSLLKKDLDAILVDGDYKSQQLKLKDLLELNTMNKPHYQDKVANILERYVRTNSIIHLQPLFIGLTLTPYSSADTLKARVLDFFKAPRPLILAIKAFFQIFKIYPILRHLSREQIDARLNPPRQAAIKSQKLQMLQTISKHIEPQTHIKQIVRALAGPATLYFYDMLQKCFKGQIQLVQTGKHSYFYRVEENKQNYPYSIKRINENMNGNKVFLWRCDCKGYYKSGLPCWHELKVCLLEKADLTLQVNHFWLVNYVPPAQRAVKPRIQHDIKHWPQNQNSSIPDEGSQQDSLVLSEIVSAGTDNVKKQYFDYSDMLNEGSHKSNTIEPKIDAIAQELQDLSFMSWELNDIKVSNIKKEEQISQRSYKEGSSQIGTKINMNVVELDAEDDEPEPKLEQSEMPGFENSNNLEYMLLKQNVDTPGQKFQEEELNMWESEIYLSQGALNLEEDDEQLQQKDENVNQMGKQLYT